MSAKILNDAAVVRVVTDYYYNTNIHEYEEHDSNRYRSYKVSPVHYVVIPKTEGVAGTVLKYSNGSGDAVYLVRVITDNPFNLAFNSPEKARVVRDVLLKAIERFWKSQKKVN